MNWSAPASSRRCFLIRPERGSVADLARVPSFACDEITGWSLTQVAGWQPAEFVAAVTAAFGIDAPVAVGGVVRQGSWTLIRIGPDRCWLIDDAAESGRGDRPLATAGLCL